MLGFLKAIEFGLSTRKIRTLFKAQERVDQDDVPTIDDEKKYNSDRNKRNKEKWIRKPNDEIIKIKTQLRSSSYDIRMPVSVLIITFIGTIFVFERYNHPNAFKYSLSSSLAAFLITYIYQFFYGRSLIGKPKITICNNCNRENNLGGKKCHCGGTYEPVEFYKLDEKL